MPRAERYTDPEYRAALKAARLDPTHAERYAADLKRYLTLAATFRASHAPSELVYPSLTAFVLATGRPYTAAARPKGLRKMTNKMCFRNALYTAMDDPTLQYVEGYALSFMGIACEHAWTVRDDGTVVDPTWYDTDLAAYYGVAIPLDIAGGLTARNRVFGVLVNDWRNDCAILRSGRVELPTREEETRD